MSTLTSLSVNKGSTRFAPKVKPRNSRATVDSAKGSNASTKATPTPTPQPAENVIESQNDVKEKSTPSKASVSVSTTAPAANATPPAITSSAPPDVTASVVPTVKKAAIDIAKKTAEKKPSERRNSVKDSTPKSAAKEPVRQLRTRAPDADEKEKEITPKQVEEPIKIQSATVRRVSRLKGKEKATEQEAEPAPTKAQTPKLAFKGQDRAVRASSRAQVQRSKETKGKAKAVDPMSRAMKAADGWTPINAKRKAAVAAEPKAAIVATSKPVTKKITKANATKTATAAAPKRKATAKITAKALEKKKTGVKKLFATDDESEATTSTTAAKATAKRAVRKPVKRKQAIVPLKKRKIPSIIPVPKIKAEKSPPPPLITLEDFSGDPMTDDILDRPMGDFIKDEKKGVVSKIFKEFEEARLKKRKRDDEMGKATASTSRPAQMSPDIPTQPEKKKKEEDGNASAGDVSLQESSHAVQFKIVNGEMQIDTESLAIRRSAMAPLITENMEIVEETSMSRMVNSQSYGKKSRSQRWTDDETNQFYNALSQWGTDFEMIARLFPHRNRRQVKLKFSREERVNPDKVTEYIIRKNKPIGRLLANLILGPHWQQIW
ncbi:hypothetical protein INT43_008575 [Umbelopsis isabellina]|uniref:SANT domain-containing protein n=1 Tax=Mortierella isabellina TaxID=91625 RepID=A0A8H7PVI0_MORIS|nr:hypothetical protein INT43_008575 [Umbelopsis isabellina]